MYLPVVFNFSSKSIVASNLLFVESPAGVGWSYSNTTSDYTCGDASAGKRIVGELSFCQFIELLTDFR